MVEHPGGVPDPARPALTQSSRLGGRLSPLPGCMNFSCAVPRRSPPQPPATSGYLLATLRVDRVRMSKLQGPHSGPIGLLAAAIFRRLLAQQERFFCRSSRYRCKSSAFFTTGPVWGWAADQARNCSQKHMDIAPRLGIQPVFDGPDFFQQGVRDHGSSSTIGKSPALQQRTVLPRCRRMGAASS